MLEATKKRTKLIMEKLDKEAKEMAVDNLFENTFITDVNENKDGLEYNIQIVLGIDKTFKYDLKVWNKSLERWMFVEQFDFPYEAEKELNKRNEI